MPDVIASPVGPRACRPQGRRHRRRSPATSAARRSPARTWTARPTGGAAPRAGRRTRPTGRWITPPTARSSEEPMSRFAQVAARNLAAAQALIPAVTHHDRADIARARGVARRGCATRPATRGVRLTALAFHVKALARCLRELPAVQRLAVARRQDADPEGLRPCRHRRRHAARPDGAGDPRRRPQGPLGDRRRDRATSPPAPRRASSAPTRWAAPR